LVHQKLSDIMKAQPDSGDVRTMLSKLRKPTPNAPPKRDEPEPEMVDNGDDDTWDIPGPFGGGANPGGNVDEVALPQRKETKPK